MGALLAWALGFNVAAIVLEFVRPRLGLLVVPIAALYAWTIYSELTDPYVGPAILRELGSDYVNLSYALSAFGLLGPLIVVLLGMAVRRRRP